MPFQAFRSLLITVFRIAQWPSEAQIIYSCQLVQAEMYLSVKVLFAVRRSRLSLKWCMLCQVVFTCLSSSITAFRLIAQLLRAILCQFYQLFQVEEPFVKFLLIFGPQATSALFLKLCLPNTGRDYSIISLTQRIRPLSCLML